MSTHVPRFQSFFRFFALFCICKISYLVGNSHAARFRPVNAWQSELEGESHDNLRMPLGPKQGLFILLISLLCW